MIITYQGDNYFKVQSGSLTVLIDPTNQRSYKGATIAINTIKPSNTNPPEEQECFWIDHQGEYEISDIYVRGWSVEAEDETEKTAYKIEFDDISLVVLGYLTKDPPQEFHEKIDGCDIIIAPAGGKPWASQASIAKFLRQVEPGIIIPSLYSDANIRHFLKEFGVSSFSTEEKFVIKKKEIQSGGMKIICISK